MTRRDAKRDECVLYHLGQYGFSLRPVISHCCFNGGNTANVLQRLVRADQIVSRSGLPGKRSYYQLTPSEAAKRGFSSSWATTISGDTLERRLAIVWYCTMTGRKRHLMSKTDLNEAIPDIKSNLSHCLERLQDKTHIISRLQVATQKDPAEIARKLVADISEDRKIKSLKRWLKLKAYRYVILADDPSPNKMRLRAITRAIKRKGIQKHTRFTVAFAPSSNTIAIALKRLKNNQQRVKNRD